MRRDQLRQRKTLLCAVLRERQMLRITSSPGALSKVHASWQSTSYAQQLQSKIARFDSLSTGCLEAFRKSIFQDSANSAVLLSVGCGRSFNTSASYVRQDLLTCSSKMMAV